MGELLWRRSLLEWRKLGQLRETATLVVPRYPAFPQAQKGQRHVSRCSSLWSWDLGFSNWGGPEAFCIWQNISPKHSLSLIVNIDWAMTRYIIMLVADDLPLTELIAAHLLVLSEARRRGLTVRLWLGVGDWRSWFWLWHPLIFSTFLIEVQEKETIAGSRGWRILAQHRTKWR